MRIGVIGHSSFVAKELINNFSDTDFELILFGRSFHVSSENIKYVQYDYPHVPLSIQYVAQCDIIYFCAGSGVQPGNDDLCSYIYELNSFEPIRIIQELIKIGYTGKIVTFGSYFELGDFQLHNPVTENELVSHSNSLPNNYCKSKRLLTRFIADILNQSIPIDFTIQHFILTNVYGPGENIKRLIPYIISESKNGNQLEFTSGEQYRQYTYIKDIVNFLRMNLHTKNSGIFNLTNPKVIQVKELIKIVITACEKKFNQEVKYNFGTQSKRDDSMSYLALDTSLSTKTFNFDSFITIEASINSYFEFYGCD
ncbi:NAD(P)-dependent oxidoreductase [Methylobacter sp. BlB1]|uniref:NAD-dependent epimerase/dehydratase family protein n=1 Tax=Methylobacter sp. BlB1 TaxID=2785914 RepID=UPI001894672B|nr:NAD(P)-dependent oxidoreductase [Methylobacter sp. BlB1]MBF6650305.1 NAD(P)-dependent oxidoreductase [Methylobacter sp. BlB1]